MARLFCKGEADNLSSLINLPTELLFKIFSYLPIRDKIMIHYVCRKFQGASEVPLLWKEFIWTDFEPRHLCSVSKILLMYGKYVRRIYFPAHVIPAKILELVCCCTRVTHLKLPKRTQVSLDDLEKIVHALTDLQQLDVFINRYSDWERPYWRSTRGWLGRLLPIIATTVKELNLRIDDFNDISTIAPAIERHGYPLPSVINIFTIRATVSLLTFWSNSISKLTSVEISLYDNKRIPMNLYPLMPLRKFKFGSAATPPLVKLSYHGVVGLQYDIFYLSEYDSHGTTRHTITRIGLASYKEISISLNENNYYNYTNHLDSVTYVDISDLNVNSNHLQQLAVVCPNLQRLNLHGNPHCLKDLQGLNTIVHMCQNLEGLNLGGISLSSVESYLLLWELLTSLKKLSHLAADLCLLNPHDLHDANKQKLIAMFKGCINLQALEINCDKSCKECNTSVDYLFSHFPSLTHCRMLFFQCSALMYAITNCHRLKYLYEERPLKCDISFSSHCHLQQLYMYWLPCNFTSLLASVLSTHGELECVVLRVHSITVSAITTVINNSPNVILFHVSVRQPLDKHDVGSVGGSCTDKVRKMFSNRKLFSVGTFSITCSHDHMPLPGDVDLNDTDLNSLWPSVHKY